MFLLWLLLLFCELRFDDCLVINPYNNYQPVAAAAAAVVCGCFADIDAEFNAPQAQQQQQLSSAQLSTHSSGPFFNDLASKHIGYS